MPAVSSLHSTYDSAPAVRSHSLYHEDGTPAVATLNQKNFTKRHMVEYRDSGITQTWFSIIILRSQVETKAGSRCYRQAVTFSQCVCVLCLAVTFILRSTSLSSVKPRRVPDFPDSFHSLRLRLSLAVIRAVGFLEEKFTLETSFHNYKI